MVNNVSRRYELHVSQGHRLFYWPGADGKRGACKLHIGDDPADDAVLIQRIEADLARHAAAPAPAPAPAPVQEVLRPRARRASTPVNIGHDQTGARFATNRPSKHEQESLTKKRKSDRAEELHQLKRVPELERFVNIARARARTAERERDSLKGCSQALAALRVEHDKTSQELQALGELNENAEDALAKLSQVPVFKMVSKGKGGGRGRLWPHWLRLMCYEQLVNCTKPSAVVKNIVSDAAWLVPWLEVKVPVVRTIRRLRYEIRSLGRALAALRVAAAARVLALGCDGTEKKQISLLSTVTQIQTVDDESETVILEGAFVKRGGTAEIEVDDVAALCFERGREALGTWTEIHYDMFDDDDPDLFPETSNVGLHRLGGGGLLQGDTCNQATLFKRLLAERIKSECAKWDPAWDTYSDAKRDEIARTHAGQCWNHLRCIWFGGASKAVGAVVKDDLADDLSNFSSYERMSTDIMNLVRAVYKEFHGEGDYAKGKGRKAFGPWVERKHPDALHFGESRASGGRQDLEYEACVPIYMNRTLYVEFLAELADDNDPEHKNILEDFLFNVLVSSDMLAAVRAYAVLYVAFVTELYVPACTELFSFITLGRGAIRDPKQFDAATQALSRGLRARPQGLLPVLNGARRRHLRGGRASRRQQRPGSVGSARSRRICLRGAGGRAAGLCHVQTRALRAHDRLRERQGEGVHAADHPRCAGEARGRDGSRDDAAHNRADRGGVCCSIERAPRPQETDEAVPHEPGRTTGVGNGRVGRRSRGHRGGLRYE